MQVTYYGQTHKVVAVDFVENLVGMRGVLQSKDEEILWARCENVTLEVAKSANAELSDSRSSKLVRPHGFIAPRGYAEPDGEYRSRCNFVWWFWLPRLHTQRPDYQNPRVIRIIWLCFAVGLYIWGDESRRVWPQNEISGRGDKGIHAPTVNRGDGHHEIAAYPRSEAPNN